MTDAPDPDGFSKSRRPIVFEFCVSQIIKKSKDKQEVISKTPSPPPFYDGNFDDDPYGILRTNTGSNKFTLGKPQVKENKKSSTLDSPAIKEKGKSPKLGTS